MSLTSKLASFFSPPADKQQAQEAYIALVERSRNPFFYTECAVPDTLDGRFEMIVLHLFLTRKDRKNADEERLILEAFFADMDRSLREMGVGDMGVSRRIRSMAEAAFGRLKAYEESVGSKDLFREALTKNVYGGKASDEPTNKLYNLLF